MSEIRYALHMHISNLRRYMHISNLRRYMHTFSWAHAWDSGSEQGPSIHRCRGSSGVNQPSPAFRGKTQNPNPLNPQQAKPPNPLNP